MEVTKQELRQRYESLETDELIDLYAKGTLTDLGSTVLSQVLESRGVTSQQRDAMVKERKQEIEQSASEEQATKKKKARNRELIITAGIAMFVIAPLRRTGSLPDSIFYPLVTAPIVIYVVMRLIPAIKAIIKR